jgi:FMN phosphatase YigB (HAD superfamily)
MTDDFLVPVFDLGGVLFDWNPLYLYRKIFESEEDAIWFLKTVCTADWNLGLDAGKDFARSVAELQARFPRYWREIAVFDTRWKEMTAGLFEGTMAIHDELIAAEVPTFSITNFSWEKWVSVLPDFPFLEKFDGVVVSGLEGLVKPDPRIFSLFCDRYSLAPETCVFIDDNPVNVVSARSIGMKAVHFTSPDQLRKELIGFGLPLTAKP